MFLSRISNEWFKVWSDFFILYENVVSRIRDIRNKLEMNDKLQVFELEFRISNF